MCVLTFFMSCAYGFFLLHLIFIGSTMHVFFLEIKWSSDLWKTHLAPELDKRKVDHGHGGCSEEIGNVHLPNAS